MDLCTEDLVIANYVALLNNETECMKGPVATHGVLLFTYETWTSVRRVWTTVSWTRRV